MTLRRISNLSSVLDVDKIDIEDGWRKEEQFIVACVARWKACGERHKDEDMALPLSSEKLLNFAIEESLLKYLPGVKGGETVELPKSIGGKDPDWVLTSESFSADVKSTSLDVPMLMTAFPFFASAKAHAAHVFFPNPDTATGAVHSSSSGSAMETPSKKRRTIQLALSPS